MGGWLIIHVLGVVLLLGNACTAAFWKVRADLSRDIAYSAKVARGIMAADYVFTVPSIIMILVSGHVMAAERGYSVFEWNWLGWSYGLFALSGILWTLVLLPAQIRMIRQAELSLQERRFTVGYKKASMVWNVFGTLATLTPIAAMVLMVIKPGG